MNNLNPNNANINNSDGNPIDLDNPLPTYVIPQTTPPIDIYFTQAVGIPTALTEDTAINDTSVTVASVTDITDVDGGTYLGIFSGTSAEGRFYFANVLNITGTGPYVLELDTPLDFAYESGDPVIATTRDLNVDGSGTSQTFSVMNQSNSPITVDITRIMFNMTLSTSGDDGKFGNLSALTKGLVFRRTNGDTRNIFNIKTNGELRGLCFDLTYPLRSGGTGDFGMGARYSFAGPDKHDVALRLEPGDSLDIIIQDNLTGLGQYRIVAPGNIRAMTE